VKSKYDIRRIFGLGVESELNLSEKEWNRSQKEETPPISARSEKMLHGELKLKLKVSNALYN